MNAPPCQGGSGLSQASSTGEDVTMPGILHGKQQQMLGGDVDADWANAARQMMAHHHQLATGDGDSE